MKTTYVLDTTRLYRTVRWKLYMQEPSSAFGAGAFFDSCSPLPFRCYLRRNCCWHIYVVECTAGLKSNKIAMGGFYPALASLQQVGVVLVHGPIVPVPIILSHLNSVMHFLLAHVPPAAVAP